MATSRRGVEGMSGRSAAGRIRSIVLWSPRPVGGEGTAGLRRHPVTSHSRIMSRTTATRRNCDARIIVLQQTCLCIRHTFVEGHSYGKSFVRNSVERVFLRAIGKTNADAGHKAPR